MVTRAHGPWVQDYVKPPSWDLQFHTGEKVTLRMCEEGDQKDGGMLEQRGLLHSGRENTLVYYGNRPYLYTSVLDQAKTLSLLRCLGSLVGACNDGNTTVHK